MTTATETLAQIDANIKAAQEFLKVADALARLKANPDFQNIVLNGYFRDEAVRLVHLKADPGVQRPESQAAILRDIDAISSFSAYLNQIQVNAQRARNAIASDEEERAEIEAEMTRGAQ